MWYANICVFFTRTHMTDEKTEVKNGVDLYLNVLALFLFPLKVTHYLPPCLIPNSFTTIKIDS